MLQKNHLIACFSTANVLCIAWSVKPKNRKGVSCLFRFCNSNESVIGCCLNG